MNVNARFSETIAKLLNTTLNMYLNGNVIGIIESLLHHRCVDHISFLD